MLPVGGKGRQVKPDSHRVIVHEQCCATCRNLDALSWFCNYGDHHMATVNYIRDRIQRPEYEVCDEWQKKENA